MVDVSEAWSLVWRVVAILVARVVVHLSHIHRAEYHLLSLVILASRHVPTERIVITIFIAVLSPKIIIHPLLLLLLLLHLAITPLLIITTHQINTLRRRPHLKPLIPHRPLCQSP